METTSIIVILIFVYTIFSAGLKSDFANVPKESLSASNLITVESISIPIDFYSVFNDEVSNSIKTFVTKNATKVSIEEAEQIVEAIIRYSQQYNVNPKLITALIHRESGFDPMSVSPSNAQGLGQLLPSTAKYIGITNPFDIDEGVKGAVIYLKMMLDKWVGYVNQVELALASYAEGPNQVFRSGGKYSDKTARYINDIYQIYKSIN